MTFTCANDHPPIQHDEWDCPLCVSMAEATQLFNQHELLDAYVSDLESVITGQCGQVGQDEQRSLRKAFDVDMRKASQ